MEQAPHVNTSEHGHSIPWTTVHAPSDTCCQTHLEPGRLRDCSLTPQRMQGIYECPFRIKSSEMNKRDSYLLESSSSVHLLCEPGPYRTQSSVLPHPRLLKPKRICLCLSYQFSVDPPREQGDSRYRTAPSFRLASLWKENTGHSNDRILHRGRNHTHVHNGRKQG